MPNLHEKQSDNPAALLTSADIAEPLSSEQLVDAADIMTQAGLEPDDSVQRAVGLYMRKERERLLGNAAFSGEPFPDRWSVFWDNLPSLLQDGLASKLNTELSDLEDPRLDSHNTDSSNPREGVFLKIRYIAPYTLLRQRERSKADRSYASGIEKLGWHERRVAKRIGKRLVSALENGDNRFPVRGGVLGIKLTQHDPETYGAIDEEYIEPRGFRLNVRTDRAIKSGSHVIAFLEKDETHRLAHDQVYPKVYWPS